MICMHVTGVGDIDILVYYIYIYIYIYIYLHGIGDINQLSILCGPPRVAGRVSLLQQDTGFLTLSGS